MSDLLGDLALVGATSRSNAFQKHHQEKDLVLSSQDNIRVLAALTDKKLRRVRLWLGRGENAVGDSARQAILIEPLRVMLVRAPRSLDDRAYALKHTGANTGGHLRCLKRTSSA